MSGAASLIEYLESPRARQSIIRLLGPDCPVDEDKDPSVRDGLFSWDRLDGEKGLGVWKWVAWKRISVTDSTPGFNHVQCYVRTTEAHPDDHDPLGRVIVSDCGETITALLKRSGKLWAECVQDAAQKSPLVKPHGEIMIENVASASAQTVAWVLAGIVKVLT